MEKEGRQPVRSHLIMILLLVGVAFLLSLLPGELTGRGVTGSSDTSSPIPIDCSEVQVPPFPTAGGWPQMISEDGQNLQNVINQMFASALGGMRHPINTAVKSGEAYPFTIDPATVNAGNPFATPQTSPSEEEDQQRQSTPTFTGVNDCEGTRKSLERLRAYMDDIIHKKTCAVNVMGDMLRQLDPLGQKALGNLNPVLTQPGVPSLYNPMLATGDGALTSDGFFFWVNSFTYGSGSIISGGGPNGIYDGWQTMTDEYQAARSPVTNLRLWTEIIALFDAYYGWYYNWYNALFERYKKDCKGGVTLKAPAVPNYDPSVKSFTGGVNKFDNPAYNYDPNKCQWKQGGKVTFANACETVNCPSPRECDPLTCRCMSKAPTLYPTTEDSTGYGAPTSRTGGGCGPLENGVCKSPGNCQTPAYCKQSSCVCVNAVCGLNGVEPGEECDPPGSACNTQVITGGVCSNACQCEEQSKSKIDEPEGK